MSFSWFREVKFGQKTQKRVLTKCTGFLSEVPPVPLRSATCSFQKCHPFLSDVPPFLWDVPPFLWDVPPVPFRSAPVPLRCAPVPLRCATRSFQKCHLSFYMCRRFSKFIGLQDIWTAFIHLMDVPFKNFWSFYDDHNVISMISFLLPACKYFHPCWFPFYSRDGAQQRSREWAS